MKPQALSIGVVQKRSQQALPALRGFVHRRPTENPTFDQARVPEDAQVAANARLLQARDQAEIANAGLTSVSQEREQNEPVRIAKRVGLTAGFLRIRQGQEPLSQAVSFSGVRDLQARGLVSHDR